jgi:aryl-alcohol dehydrogenase-like predicted oxidoreductase
MQTRRLGRTGHDSSVAILGGVVFHFVEEEEAGEILHDAIARGVNHLDIAPGYGSAEATVGPHIPAVRDRLFIGEKSGKTTRDDVRRHLDRTLTRLGIANVDLYQLHGVTDVDDLNRREGAVQALLEARDEGLCTWIGITGHKFVVMTSTP